MTNTNVVPNAIVGIRGFKEVKIHAKDSRPRILEERPHHTRRIPRWKIRKTNFVYSLISLLRMLTGLNYM